jgi:hypothetical protein
VARSEVFCWNRIISTWKSESCLLKQHHQCPKERELLIMWVFEIYFATTFLLRSWRSRMSCVTSAIGWRHGKSSLWRQPLADVTKKRFFMTSAIGWRHKKRFFMTSAIGWRHKKRFFMTSATGWRHEDVSQWLRDTCTVKKHKFQTEGIIPLLKCRILFCSRFLTPAECLQTTLLFL